MEQADQPVEWFVVFASVLAMDTRQAAAGRVAHPGDRYRSYWDPDKKVGRALADSLGIQSLAWDVYLVFPPGSRWLDDPPQPADWAHQLAGADEARFRGGRIESWLREEIAGRVE